MLHFENTLSRVMSCHYHDAHYFQWLSRNQLGETARNVLQLNVELFQVQCQAKDMTRQRAFSKSYTKIYRKKESQSKALRVICEVEL